MPHNKILSYHITLAAGLILATLSLTTYAVDSVCYGTTGKGRLENGVTLPAHGVNFISYGSFPELAGRTYVHSKVKRIVVDAYTSLLTTHPDKVFKYAETGFKSGGKFKPHKTHQNGLSIDFMVPVVNGSGKSVHFATNILNKYGYNVNFNRQGQSDEYTLDFAALGAHLVALHKASIKYKAELWRVLFAPDLQAKLYATQYGDYIRQNIHIPKKRSWVRHDEHYHVDFKIPCKAL